MNAFDFGSLGASILITLAQSDAGCATVLRFGHPDGAKRKTGAYLYTEVVFLLSSVFVWLDVFC